MARKRKREEDQAGFGQETGGQRPQLTPVDIQQKVFRLAFRGYNERDVDEFLDRVTEDLAALHEENKRLREQGGGGGGHSLDAARDEAEAIVREAREHAARLLEDAGGAASAGAGGLSASFLIRERDFLQRMAQSVQEHARWLKEEAQRQKAAGGGGVATSATATKAKAAKAPGAKQGRAGRKKAAAGKAAVAGEAGSAGEATAAWGPAQGGMAEAASGLTQDPTTGEPDPLLSAWESAFTGEGPAEAKKGSEGEPSLRELFWGEE